MQADDLQQVENAETAPTTTTTTIATTQALNKKNTKKKSIFKCQEKYTVHTHVDREYMRICIVYIEKIFAKSFSFSFNFLRLFFEPSHKNTKKKNEKNLNLLKFISCGAFQYKHICSIRKQASTKKEVRYINIQYTYRIN